MLNWKKCTPLTNEELHDTACKAVAGDPKAIELLVSSNVKLASSLAYQYSDFDGMNVEDLTSEALMGLIESIPTFDPERGTKFTTYAAWRMRMRVLNYVIDNFRLVKIGTTQAQKKIFWRLNRDTEALRKEGTDPTEQALAERIDVKAKEIREMQIRMNHSESSLDVVYSPNDYAVDRGITLFDTLDNGEETPEQYVTDKRMVTWMQARMIEFEQTLTGKYLIVWNYRIASEEPETMDTVSKRIGRTRQRVKQIDYKLRTAFKKYVKNQARE